MAKNKGKSKRSLEPNLFMARLAEQSERYTDMFGYLSEALIARQDPAHFTQEERNMLSVAFKNLISPKRSTWRHIMASKESSDSNEAVRAYKEYVEKKLHVICLQIVNLVQNHVLPAIEAHIKKHML